MNSLANKKFANNFLTQFLTGIEKSNSNDENQGTN
jgi:hypothetical protein